MQQISTMPCAARPTVVIAAVPRGGDEARANAEDMTQQRARAARENETKQCNGTSVREPRPSVRQAARGRRGGRRRRRTRACRGGGARVLARAARSSRHHGRKRAAVTRPPRERHFEVPSSPPQTRMGEWIPSRKDRRSGMARKRARAQHRERKGYFARRKGRDPTHSPQCRPP